MHVRVAVDIYWATRNNSATYIHTYIHIMVMNCDYDVYV